MTNSTTEAVNSRTCPKRRVSQPVSGSEMALATPKEVMTQVPWSGETPRSPAMAGVDTLAIDVSSTFMNVASDSAIVPRTSCAPASGCSPPAPRREHPAVGGLSGSGSPWLRRAARAPSVSAGVGSRRGRPASSGAGARCAPVPAAPAARWPR